MELKTRRGDEQDVTSDIQMDGFAGYLSVKGYRWKTWDLLDYGTRTGEVLGYVRILLAYYNGLRRMLSRTQVKGFVAGCVSSINNHPDAGWCD